MPNQNIPNSWKYALKTEIEQEYYVKLWQFVDNQYQNHICYPPKNLIFNALILTDYKNVKVVIIGQDPYHGPTQANGLAFSVNDGVKIPPSLANIFKELNADLQIKIPNSGNLISWAQQGVLLLNATLTVEQNKAGSHQKQGWEQFTDAIIRILNEQKSNVVFMLWGNYAQKKGKIIDTEKHLVLMANHPSPLSAHRGWFGSKHFSKANEYLIEHGIEPIDWEIKSPQLQLNLL